KRCLPSADAQRTCHELLGHMYRTQARWADAVSEYAVALHQAPAEFSNLLGSYATALVRSGRADEAERMIDGFHAAHPDDAAVLAVGLWPAQQRGDAAEARRRLDDLTRLPKLSAYQLNNAAWWQLEPGGDLDRGLELAKRAVGLAKRSPSARNTLALIEAER